VAGITFVMESGAGGSKGMTARHFIFDNVLCAAQGLAWHPAPSALPSKIQCQVRKTSEHLTAAGGEMTTGNEIEAQPVSLCRFRSSHLIEESGGRVALADGGVANPLCTVCEKAKSLTSLLIFALVGLCLSHKPGDSSCVSLPQSLPFRLSRRPIALGEDRK
jgi:hypothetical protein